MENVLEKVKAPAISLIVVGSLNGIVALLSLLGGLLRLTGIMGAERLPTSEAERAGYLIGTVGGYAIAFVGLIIAPIIIYGGIKMLRGQSYGLAKTAAILAIIPFLSCCFIVGIPIGIWVLVVLRDPFVKAFFKGEINPNQFNPPQPPNF